MKEALRNGFFRLWYRYISTVDKNGEVTFMNYGFSRDHHEIDSESIDKEHKYSAQLYNFIAKGATIKNKDILEVGCGRGGGLIFIYNYFEPNSATGLDMDKKSIEFCRKHYNNGRAEFYQGNAQNINFQDHAFDVVLNVESSHRYPRMQDFLNEAYRVLKPGGYLLFADFRHSDKLDNLHNQFVEAGFTLLKNENITEDVLKALRLSSNERTQLISKLAPSFLRGLGKKFAATEGTPTYNKFKDQRFKYVHYILKKPQKE